MECDVCGEELNDKELPDKHMAAMHPLKEFWKENNTKKGNILGGDINQFSVIIVII